MSEGVEEVARLAEFLRVPVCTTYLHNDAFPSSHPLAMGPLGYQVGYQRFPRLPCDAGTVYAILLFVRALARP
jgi:sulfoacetaldehyde acetyltransferase